MKRRLSDYLKWIILICVCFVMVGSNPEIIHGYIDRMNPAIILLEDLHEEMVIEVETMPEDAAEGMWVDVTIVHGEYEIIRVNDVVTSQKEAEIMKLQKKIQRHSLRYTP